MVSCKVVDFKNKEVGAVELPADLFEMAVDKAFLSNYIYKLRLANHVPTNKTKVISEVSGTTAKPYKQKGTGNARQGSKRSPQMRGGACIFGPRGESYAVKINKKESILARKMSLAAVVQKQAFSVIDACKVADHKTSTTLSHTNSFAKDKNILIIHDGEAVRENILGARNLHKVLYTESSKLTVYDLSWADTVLITKKAAANLF